MAEFPILRMRGLEAAPGALRRDAWLGPVPTPTDSAEGRRCRIWDLSGTLHCSIIGTCLTATELRRLFMRLGDADARTATDHALHSRGVHIAGQRTPAAKLLHKTLDKRHAGAIRRFGKAGTVEEVGLLWRNAVDRVGSNNG